MCRRFTPYAAWLVLLNEAAVVRPLPAGAGRSPVQVGAPLVWALVPTHRSGAKGQGDCAPPLSGVSAWQSRSGLEPQVRERSRPSLSGLAWHGQSTAYACVAALSLLAVPSNVREGEGPPPPPVGPRPTGAAHHQCVCSGTATVGCALQREGGDRAPPRRVSPGSRSALPVRVSRPGRRLL